MLKINPNDFYNNKIRNCKKSLKQIEQKTSIFLYCKLLFFALFVASFVVWIYYSKDNMFWLYGTIGFMIYILFVHLDSRVIEKQRFIKKQVIVLSNELRNLSGIFTYDDGSKYISNNHPFTFDIDIFGQGSLFHRINRTITVEGANKLAKTLSNVGIDKEKIQQRQAAISELTHLTEFRISFQCIGEGNKPIGYNNIVIEPEKLNISLLKWIVRISWCVTAIAFFTLVIITFLNISTVVPLTILMISICINGMFSIYFFYRSGKIINRIDSLIKCVLQYSPVLELYSKNNFDSKLLNEIKAEFTEQKKSVLKLRHIKELFHFRNNAILWVLANCLFILDIYAVLKFLLWEKQNLSKLPQLFTSVAHLDALVSLANYNFNHPNTTLPQFTEKGIDAQCVYHPFIMTRNIVGNDYVQEENSISIITGANMSGKSTFLRAIALNLILSNAGCKVFAEKFAFNPQIKLFTSMRTQDNITIGKSYFNAEIDRLSHAIDYSLSNYPTLLILDEVLKGTNSEDKLQGTLELLDFFSKQGFMAIVATHDIGVTLLEKEYGESKFKNYCFEIELNNPIVYTYKLFRGICKNRNASYILSHMLSTKK